MIIELVDIRIHHDQQTAFEAALRRGLDTVLSQAPGFRGAQIHRGIESAERYVLFMEWETIEHHTVDFRGGPLFAQWRAIVGPYFAAPPAVEHFSLLTGHG